MQTAKPAAPIFASMMVLLVACTTPSGPGPRPSPPPSEADALALLQHVITLTRAGDFDGLCEVGGGNCEQILESAGRQPPRRDPVVVGQRTQEAQLYDDSYWSASQRILELCGLRDDGSTYYTEMGVSSDGSRLVAFEPVFWSSLRMGNPSHTANGRPQNDVADCAARGFPS